MSLFSNYVALFADFSWPCYIYKLSHVQQYGKNLMQPGSVLLNDFLKSRLQLSVSTNFFQETTHSWLDATTRVNVSGAQNSVHSGS